MHHLLMCDTNTFETGDKFEHEKTPQNVEFSHVLSSYDPRIIFVLRWVKDVRTCV